MQGLWISPLAAIPQVGRNPRLVYHFSSRGLNEKVKLVAPKDTMRFRQELHFLLDFILTACQILGTTFISKVAIDDAYNLI